MPFREDLVADLVAVRGARVLFVHHSVGGNVLDGLRRLDDEYGPPGARVRIVPLAEAAFVDGPAVVHASGGENGDPDSKIAFFKDLFTDRPWLQPQLALMKLCYVDITPATDVTSLFLRYQRAIVALASQQPKTRFGHVTTPLTQSPFDFKSVVRRAAGFDVWEDAANEKRRAYNRLLRQVFLADPVFDLAAAEVGPDRSSLNPVFTEDGGHLNGVGARVVAAAFVRFLAGALR